MASTTEPAIGFYTADSRLLDRIYAVARLNGSPFSPRYATEIGNVYALLHKLVQSKEQLKGQEGLWRMVSQAYVANRSAAVSAPSAGIQTARKSRPDQYAKPGSCPTGIHPGSTAGTGLCPGSVKWPSQQFKSQRNNPSNQVRVPLTSFAGRSAPASLDPSNQEKVQEKSEARKAPTALDKEEDRVMPWDDIETPLEGLTEASERAEEPSTPDPFVNSFAAAPVAPPTEQSHPGAYTDRAEISRDPEQLRRQALANFKPTVVAESLTTAQETERETVDVGEDFFASFRYGRSA